MAPCDAEWIILLDLCKRLSKNREFVLQNGYAPFYGHEIDWRDRKEWYNYFFTTRPRFARGASSQPPAEIVLLLLL